jgi:hypothetical protein
VNEWNFSEKAKEKLINSTIFGLRGFIQKRCEEFLGSINVYTDGRRSWKRENQ